MPKIPSTQKNGLIDWLQPIIPDEPCKRTKQQAALDLRQELIDTRQKCSSSEEKLLKLLMNQEYVKYELSQVTRRITESEEVINSLLEEVSRLEELLDADKRKAEEEIEQEMVDKAPKCPICLLPFDKHVVPKIGFCGHSVCHVCSVFLKDCPICRVAGSFLRPRTNFLAAEFTNNFSFPCNEAIQQSIRGQENNEDIDERDRETTGDEDYLDDEEWDSWTDEWADEEDLY